MTELPSSIEAYLTEAKFASTEIMILRKLLEGDALSLREIGGKTGKSSGVLDQAMKKLVEKRIVKRDVVNGNPKFVLSSLDAIAEWIKKDMHKKREVLKRKQEDFESFIASLKTDHNKPEIHYFEGEEGMKKAYMELLKHGKEILYYKPMMEKEEEDPLRPFFVDWFRARHRAGVHLKVLAQNNALGRRYQSRDAFEYRETVLVPHEQFTFDFEKVIVGDIVACINRQEQKASFVRYKELASTERNLFHMLWMLEKGRKNPAQASTEVRKEEPDFGLSTKAISALREFFLSRKSIAVLVFLGIVAAGLTYGLYERAVYVNTQRVREEVKAIAATGALQFDDRNIEAIRTKEDITKPEYSTVINKLNEIRSQNSNIRYAYIMRKTDDPDMLEFVADADSINPNVISDINHDGKVDDQDENAAPGRLYPVDGDQDLLAGFNGPSASKEPFPDQWGIWISEFAPIRDAHGNTVALFGIDRDASDVQTLTKETINPFLVFFLFFIAFILLRLAAFDRSLMKEIFELLKTKKVVAKVLLPIFLCGCIALAFTYVMYKHTLRLMHDEVGTRLMSIASTAAPHIDHRDLEKLRKPNDLQSPEYERVFSQLNEIRKQNISIKFVWILRPTNDEKVWQWVADADSSKELGPFTDENGDGVMQLEEQNIYPGAAYELTESQKKIARGLFEPIFEEGFVSDQWGRYITAYAPIRDANDKGIAILGIDMKIDDFKTGVNRKFVPWLWMLFASIILSSSLLIFYRLRK